MPIGSPARLKERLSDSLIPLALFSVYGFMHWALSSHPGTEIYFFMWQFLSPEHLLHDPIGSLIDLHSQPPLLNVLLWLTLYLDDRCAVPLDLSATAIMFAVALCCCVCWFAVARHYLKSRALAAVLLAGLLLNPSFYLFTRLFFYPNMLMALFGVFFWSLWKWAERPSMARLIGLALIFTLIVYLRSLWHPLAALPLGALIGAHLWLRNSDWKAGLKSGLIFCGIVAALAAPWIVKNAVLFNSPSFSSWSAINLRLVTGDPFYDFIYQNGKYDSRQVNPFYSEWQLQRIASHPALNETIKAPYQTSRYVNLNHYAIPALNHEMMQKKREWLKRYPILYLDRCLQYQTLFALPSYYRPYTLEDNQIDYQLLINTIYSRMHADLYYGEIIRRGLCGLLGEWASPINIFMLAFYISMLTGLIRGRRLGTQEGLLTAAMVFCCLWVWAMGTFIDGTESQRMRWHMEPAVLCLFFGGIAWIIRKVKSGESDETQAHQV
ncbi:hypothetical protein JXA32_01970 [Candidatus Sumerlaeota bacterium]|nr:hypothetical protein [Candidatus Sumerlaeota bacterium]